MNLKVYRMRPGVKLPTRAYQTDAGVDLYYSPNGDKKLSLQYNRFVTRTGCNGDAVPPRGVLGS